MTAKCFRFIVGIAITAALPVYAGLVRADVVTLDNGDRLSGRVEHKSGNTLILKTEYAGRVSIAWDRVKSITTDKPVRVMLKDSDRVVASRLLPGGAGAATLAQVAYINPTPAESGMGTTFSGRATLSSAYVRGNSTNSRLYAQGELTVRARAYRYTLGLKGERSSDSGQRTVSNWLGDASLDRFIDEKRFYYGRVSLENNRYKDLSLRSTLGGGYGFQFIETERTKLSLRGGLDYVAIDRKTGEDDRYPAAGWGLKFSHLLQAYPLELFHEHDGFLSLKDTDSMTLRSRSGLRMPIAGGLNASLQLNADWERSPAPGRKSTDTTMLLGLSYGW